MKKLFLIFALLVMTSSAALAETAKVSVNGLVCDFCARALEKVFSKKEEVQNIEVDLSTKIITINFHEGQSISDEELTKYIVDSGYDVEAIERVELTDEQ
jgi:cation transport ATPase